MSNKVEQLVLITVRKWRLVQKMPNFFLALGLTAQRSNKSVHASSRVNCTCRIYCQWERHLLPLTYILKWRKKLLTHSLSTELEQLLTQLERLSCYNLLPEKNLYSITCSNKPRNTLQKSNHHPNAKPLTTIGPDTGTTLGAVDFSMRDCIAL